MEWELNNRQAGINKYDMRDANEKGKVERVVVGYTSFLKPRCENTST